MTVPPASAYAVDGARVQWPQDGTVTTEDHRVLLSRVAVHMKDAAEMNVLVVRVAHSDYWLSDFRCRDATVVNTYSPLGTVGCEKQTKHPLLLCRRRVDCEYQSVVGANQEHFATHCICLHVASVEV